MKKNYFSFLFFATLIVFLFSSTTYCQAKFVVNKSHLDYLYEEINVAGKEMAIIHIYSNAPDYKYVGDDDEGYTCVDDVARAAIFYLEYFKAYDDSSSLEKLNLLIEFVKYMQAENGYFYNFIWEDGSINKTFRTSLAEPNWWSWRALWALMEYYKYFDETNSEPIVEVKSSVEIIINAIKKNIPSDRNKSLIDGIEIPDWLPANSASDQAALLVLCLSDYYKISGDEEILKYVQSLIDGILMMQIKNEDCEFNGAFLSWQNTWHGWGNSQSYSLLKAYQILKDKKIKEVALYELDNFYERLIEIDFLSYFKVQNNQGKYEIVESNKFSQISYSISPMIFALLEAYTITSDSIYAINAGKFAQWFTGGNPAKTVMYNPHNGIFFDGIENENLVNKNSGAESTIEGLLSLLKISLNPIALKEFEKKD
ncbi:MAG TPA: hypothetical protein VLN45_10630 [Ignavibacteriaceae bacterium]|nr:hypothetical protein [Ignavibacteriaceae bacterium]